MDLIRDVMEKAARSTPATIEEHGSGWWLRHTDSGTWWAGAVLAHGPSHHMGDRIAAAEQFYTDHGAVARFQVCPACPERLNEALADRGYRLEAPVQLLIARRVDYKERDVSPELSVQSTVSPTKDWTHVLKSNQPNGDTSAELRMMAQVKQPSVFVTAYDGDEPVGIGRAVADDGWAGVFHMVTAPPARGRGVAGFVLTTISKWAYSANASSLYLQVERSNTIAQRLYTSAGFSHLADYHYRVAAMLPNKCI